VHFENTTWKHARNEAGKTYFARVVIYVCKVFLKLTTGDKYIFGDRKFNIQILYCHSDDVTTAGDQKYNIFLFCPPIGHFHKTFLA